MVTSLASKSFFKIHDGISIALCNSPILVSEVGDKILQSNSSVLVVFLWRFNHELLKVECSVRSRAGTNYARVYAEKFGGGGHDQAAGFTLEQGDERNRFMFTH